MRSPISLNVPQIGPCILRPLVETDQGRIEQAWSMLSEKSRMERFWTRQDHLSRSMLERLSKTDGVQHGAWVILKEDEPEIPGLGAASWWRDRRRPDLAEVAFTIGDPWQRQGLATLLLARLWLETWEQDIRKLEGYARIANTTVVNWWRGCGGDASSDGYQQHLTLSLSTPDDVSPQIGQRLKHWLDVLQEDSSD